VINDVAVRTLANNRAFQRFALKTHYVVEDAKHMATSSASNIVENVQKAAPRVQEFAQAFKEEVAKDINKSAKR
jgi:uncharacterized surface protein with fasciclin (FAS1) repeats